MTFVLYCRPFNELEIVRCEIPLASIFFLKSDNQGWKFAPLLPQEAAFAGVILVVVMVVRDKSNRAEKVIILFIERIHSLVFIGPSLWELGGISNKDRVLVSGIPKRN